MKKLFALLLGLKTNYPLSPYDVIDAYSSL